MDPDAKAASRTPASTPGRPPLCRHEAIRESCSDGQHRWRRGRARPSSRPPRRVRGARPAGGGGPRRREPGAGGARRGGRGQDGAAGLPGRAGAGLPGGARRRASSRRWSWRSPGCISCARRCWTGWTAAGAAAGGAADRVRHERRAGAGPVPGRPGRAEPAVGGGRGAAAGLPGRRRAVAGSRLGAGPGVRRPGGWARSRSAWSSRPASRAASWPGCRSWWSAGCAEADARALLDSVLTGPLDARVRDQIVAETRGNPLALLELPRGLTPAELAGGFGLPGAVPLPGGSRRASGGGWTRCRPKPGGCCCWRRPTRPATRRWCGGRPGGSGSAPTRPRPRPRPAWPSSAPGCGSGIRWCARRPTGRRRLGSGRQVHRALAEATDPRARSRPAGLAPGPGRAGAGRGGRRRAGALGRPGPGARRAGRGGRVPGAGRGADARPGAAGRAGAGRGAGQGPGGRVRRGAGAAGHGRGRAAQRAPAGPCRPAAGPARVRHQPGQRRPAAAAARRPGGSSRIDAGLSRATYLDALSAAIFAGRLASPGGSVLEVARAAAARPRRRAQPPRALDLLLDGLAAHSPRGTRPGCRCCARRWRPSASGMPAEDGTALAVAGLVAAAIRSGTTSAGTRCPPGTSSWPARPARSASFRSP